jgi:hypothetical protein
MNTMLLIAFGLVAIGAIIRLVLFLTHSKEHTRSEAIQ